jgi:hypothetical protein
MQITLDDGKSITVKGYTGPHDGLMEQIATKRAAGWRGSRLFMPVNYPGTVFDYDEYLGYLRAMLSTNRDPSRVADLQAQIADLTAFWDEGATPSASQPQP